MKSICDYRFSSLSPPKKRQSIVPGATDPRSESLNLSPSHTRRHTRLRSRKGKKTKVQPPHIQSPTQPLTRTPSSPRNDHRLPALHRLDDRDQRQEQRDDDRADHHGQKHDHDRLEQRS